ncbi:MAG: tannase/feruloyl esterase family alpha/beta hydrolase [Comamonadaceae bacterium]|nr:MAG: tannase/feruloyl esterase family alpha/beta hydrolase [Comamonadaceae bacterium]
MHNSTLPRAPWRAGLTLLAAGLLAACGGGGEDRASLDAPRAQALCEELAAGAGLPATTLAPQYVQAGSKRPGNATTGDFLGGHCVVTGAMNPRVGVDGKNYAIGFQLSLPDRWNGRFLYLGGGGNDGSLGNTSAAPGAGMVSPLLQGYAVVSTDAGHQGGTAASFGFDPQARIDHAYNAHDKTAQAAKSLISSRYGRGPNKSYFQGCSGGGRQGMMFSQRFPDYFDGIVATAPAMRVSSGATVAAMWNNIQFTSVAPNAADGKPILSQALSNADLTLVAGAATAACDAADGAADGMVSNFRACKFDPVVLQCSGAKTASCLSAPQVGALQKVLAGPRNSAGVPLYAGQPADPGIAAPGWRAWMLGSSATSTPNSAYNTLMSDALRHEFFTPPDPGFDILKFNFDTDPARMEAFSAVYDTYRDAALSGFRNRGGKLLLVHGMADPIFSALDTQDYYERLAANNGGMGATQSFARAFFVPGMNHCGGGPATDAYDPLQAVVDWVEKGQAPEVIAAAAQANNSYFANRTRPLCPYPKFAKYKGSGSLEDAANFSCSEN